MLKFRQITAAITATIILLSGLSIFAEADSSNNASAVLGDELKVYGMKARVG